MPLVCSIGDKVPPGPSMLPVEFCVPPGPSIPRLVLFCAFVEGVLLKTFGLTLLVLLIFREEVVVMGEPEGPEGWEVQTPEVKGQKVLLGQLVMVDLEEVFTREVSLL